MKYVVQNIKLPISEGEQSAFALAEKRLSRLFSKGDIGKLEVCKKSVDARKKNDICFVWSVTANVNSSKTYSAEALAKEKVVLSKPAKLDISYGDEKLQSRPVIVGFGPCGMFCALILAQNGYRPIVIERGSDVEKRSADVELFKTSGKFNPESNIQFGAGGAGTFSDGKLVTRINDEKCAVVIEQMHAFGAPDDILYRAKPHVGTDYLKKIVTNIKNEIVRLGGEIRFDTKFEGLVSSVGKVTAVKTNNGEIPCGVVVIAIGHSARDTFSNIKNQGILLTPKPFSVGMRIEHLQSDIDKALYGDMAGNPLLPKGEYNFSHRLGNGRGVYTFCMCPGGEVVAAASEEQGVVTNGMSNYLRDGKNANSAIAVSVLPEDYGNSVDGAIEFQRRIERAAKMNASYAAPAITVGDFINKTGLHDFSKVTPTYMGGNVVLSDMKGIFPEFVTDGIREGILDFDMKIKGFADSAAVLTAPETRTSSPVRIPRSDFYTADGFDNVYPCGEGAGYAGGITSAGVDGINCALGIMQRYKI